jgi:protein O-GlcNAc transferase
MQARFLGAGVDPGQLEFEGHSSGAEYEQAFAQIDLALDPSPCPGGTTTLEAFSHGVPVLTRDGEDFYARMGVQPMMALGLPEMIAGGWDDYVEKAVALAHDLPGLARLRAEIRPRFDASAYREAATFARRLEDVYRRLFHQWLTRQSGATELAA